MRRSKANPADARIDQMLGEASWLLSHAEALADYRRTDEAALEWLRAASCEEQVACLLEAAGREREAAIHRISAASCHEQLAQYPRAVTLLRAALSAQLPQDYRATVVRQLTRCLAQAKKRLGQASPGVTAGSK